MNYTPAVVVDIVLNETSEYFSIVGGYNGIGTVVYKEFSTKNYNAIGFAKPYFPNIYNIPLKNELIYVFELPNPDVQNNINKRTSYYITPINVWNSVHHNAIPNIFKKQDISDSQKQDYQQTEIGAVRRVQDSSTEIDLGDTFVEKTSIKPLTKYEGDVTIEGRWGNSIRLGSTVISGSKALNDWSYDGINGDPIIILRNGQNPNIRTAGFIPTTESISTDLSSIYLTSTQKIQNLNKTQYSSYTSDSPISPNQYKSPQIILKSNRLYLNSTNDHILLESNKSINLKAESSVNLETTNNIVLESSKVYLGSKKAIENIVLGNTLKTQLDTLIQALDVFATACENTLSTPAGTPIATIKVASTVLKNTLSKINTENILSEDVFTI